jgi:hypothetical protein
MGFTPESIAANLASFDARTFRQPPDDWRPTASPDKATWFEGSGDALIGDLIRDGVTGVSGQGCMRQSCMRQSAKVTAQKGN